MKKSLLPVGIIFLLICCTAQKDQIPAADTMQEPRNKMVIYQMMTRLFGNKTTVNKMYGTIEENGVGKFNDIDATALKAIKELGITHVWYTGVLEHALLTDYTAFNIAADDADVVKGRAGSPYAIKDYYDVNPDLAVSVPDRMKEFESLVERTHQAGMKVLIDFVPNHVARAYKSDARPSGVKDLGEDDDQTVSFAVNNNFYYLPGQTFQVPQGYNPLGRNTHPTEDHKFTETPAKVTGNDQFTASPGVNEWFETIKLNYGVDIQNGRKTHFDSIPDTWTKMLDILKYWTGKKVDGFRCDMAEMVPVEFWKWAIPQVKVINPDVVFIAEIYNPDQYKNYIQNGRFDFLYDKVLLYDTLRMLLNGERSARDIHQIQSRLNGINRYMLHFLENHDEQRLASRFFAGDMWKGIPAMVVSATIDQGPVMIYFGQEVGEPGTGAEGFQGDDGRTTIFDYWGVPEHQKWMNNGKFDGGLLSQEQKELRSFYSNLLNLSQKNPAIAEGEYIDVTDHNVTIGNIGEDVHAFIRYKDDELLLVVTSYNTGEKEAKIAIPATTASEIGLASGSTYSARDLLWREAKISLADDFSFALQLKPYSAYIFKISKDN